MIYSDSLKNTCLYLNLKIPYNEGRWPSSYVGENYLDFNRINKILPSTIDDKCLESDFDEFSEYYYAQKDMEHNMTDLCFLFVDWFLSRNICDNCSAEDYFKFLFYNKSLDIRKTYICSGHRYYELPICNDYAAFSIIPPKNIFNKTFHEFIHRDWLDLSEANTESIKKFFLKHSKTVLKPNSGSEGKGVKFLKVSTQDEAERLATQYAGRFMVLEEAITQEASIAAFNPTTLNTIRICTFKGKDNSPMIICAAGRYGRYGTGVDNFSVNGIAATIDVTSGRVISDGVDKSQNIYTSHPDSGLTFRGFQYPNWENVRAVVLNAASLVPGARHVGWDIAINPDGTAELIEGNLKPGIYTLQLPDQKGKMPIYKSLVQEFTEWQKEEMQKKGHRIHNFPGTYFRYSVKPQSIKQLACSVKSYLMNNSRSTQVISSLPYQRLLQDNLACCITTQDQWTNIIKKYTAFEPVECDFLNMDACVMLLSLEYIKDFSSFLTNICQVTSKQIIVVCRPFDKESNHYERWRNSRFVLDFTEDWLKKEMSARGFALDSSENIDFLPSVYLYNFIAFDNH